VTIHYKDHDIVLQSTVSRNFEVGVYDCLGMLATIGPCNARETNVLYYKVILFTLDFKVMRSFYTDKRLREVIDDALLLRNLILFDGVEL